MNRLLAIVDGGAALRPTQRRPWRRDEKIGEFEEARLHFAAPCGSSVRGRSAKEIGRNARGISRRTSTTAHDVVDCSNSRRVFGEDRARRAGGRGVIGRLSAKQVCAGAQRHPRNPASRLA